MADRFTYMPIIGIFIILVWGIADWAISPIGARWRMTFSVLAILICGLMLTLTRLQLQHWRNSLTLFEHALAVTPENDVTDGMLGGALNNAGRTDEALVYFGKALK